MQMRTGTVGTAVASARAAPDQAQGGAEGRKSINPELWQACAGPLVNPPVAGTLVVYFPQGHSEQVAASLRKDINGQAPSYPNLPCKLFCHLHSVTLEADPETDEVYSQMILQPVPSFDKNDLLRSDLSLKTHKPQPDFFCKILTASDTSTHGGFSVPRRAAEKIFPPLDYSTAPPAQEIVARDLHGNVWNFRHIFRGQPKRHLLTTGWSLFISGKRLSAGDSVLFIRDEKQQLLLGIRRANRQSTNLSSSVLSSDSMHIGILAAAAHAAANNSLFTVFFNPRASPSEFVIPLAKYYRAVYGNQISLGMRFRMMFETEDSGTRRYMGTITGISDLDPVRWQNSQWRNMQVAWDESTAGDKRTRVSVWEIEPVTAPFFICPSQFFGSKRSREPGMTDADISDLDNAFKRTMPWLGDDFGMRDSQGLPALSLVQWMNMHSLSDSVNPNIVGSDCARFPVVFGASQITQPRKMQFSNPKRLTQQMQQVDQLPKLPCAVNVSGSMIQPLQSLNDSTLHVKQNATTETLPSSQAQGQALQPQALVHGNNNEYQQHLSSQNQQLFQNLRQNLSSQQQPQKLQSIMSQKEQQSLMQPRLPGQQHLHMPDNQVQLQILQKLQQQQQAFLSQQSQSQQQAQLPLIQEQQRQLLNGPRNFPSPATEMSQMESVSVPQSNAISLPITKGSSQVNVHFSHAPQLPKQQQEAIVMPDVLGNGSISPIPNINNLNTNGGYMGLDFVRNMQSAPITEDGPSCSTSPSMNNCPNAAKKCEVKHSLNISNGLNQGVMDPCFYLNGAAAQADQFDTSSTTSVSISQNEGGFQRNNNMPAYSPHSMVMRHSRQQEEVQADVRMNVPYCNDVDNQVGISVNTDPILTKDITVSGRDISDSLVSGCMLSNYENSKDAQQELSSSMVSQSLSVPDVTFNSMDSTINDASYINHGPWAPPSQFQRMRTFTKVYKRGAVGRSIDITRYSGYGELKQDLARRFGIEGQLEDRRRIGWKLVYVDHENDVLLVGDDPWDEFVNCVRCIKILSPQEVQQMSLEGDIGNCIIQNHAGSSSENGA